jgi:hypothetical protein
LLEDSDRFSGSWERAPRGALGLVVSNPFLEPLLSKSGLTKVAEHSTHWLKIAGLSREEIERRHFNRVLRATLRKANREGLQVVSGTSETLIRDFFRMHVLSSRRWGYGRPVRTLPFFLSLKEKPWATFHIAYRGDEPVSGVIIVKLGRQDYYWYGCMDKVHAGRSAGIFVLAHAMGESARTGAEVFNLGSGGRYPGVYEFKKSFGGDEVPYGVYYSGGAVTAQILRALYRYKY